MLWCRVTPAAAAAVVLTAVIPNVTTIISSTILLVFSSFDPVYDIKHRCGRRLFPSLIHLYRHPNIDPSSKYINALGAQINRSAWIYTCIKRVTGTRHIPFRSILSSFSNHKQVRKRNTCHATMRYILKKEIIVLLLEIFSHIFPFQVQMLPNDDNFQKCSWVALLSIWEQRGQPVLCHTNHLDPLPWMVIVLLLQNHLISLPFWLVWAEPTGFQIFCCLSVKRTAIWAGSFP